MTNRGLTALDIVTAYSPIPGRGDVGLLLEEAMREQGWTGGRVEERRRLHEKQTLKTQQKKKLQDQITKALDIDPRWWGDVDLESSIEDSSDDGDGDSHDFDIYVRGSFSAVIKADIVL